MTRGAGQVADVSRGWWVPAVRGVAAIALAVVAFVWPRMTLTLLMGFFGVYVLVDGVLDAAAAARAKREGGSWWLPAAEAVAGIGIGAATFVVPDATGRVLIALIGVWAVVTGVLRLYERRLGSVFRDASNSKLDSPYRYGNHTWTPAPGWLALFPAHVPHEVSVVRCDTPLVLVFAMVRFAETGR